MKKALAALITIALIGVVLWKGRDNLSSTSRTVLATPDACIEEMFRAAGEGDVTGYLNCFAGAERERLERELAGQSAEAFAQSLIEAVASLKGRALEGGPTDPDAVQAERTVARVYASRIERQMYRLEKRADVWRITSVRTAEAFQPQTPYGTPVFEMPAQQPDE